MCSALTYLQYSWDFMGEEEISKLPYGCHKVGDSVFLGEARLTFDTHCL